MEPTDLTLAVLREIRDGVSSTNERLDHVVERVDQVVKRVDQVVESVDQVADRVDRLERRQVEMESRLATELIAVVDDVNQVKDILVSQSGLREQVDDHERRLAALEESTGGR